MIPFGHSHCFIDSMKHRSRNPHTAPGNKPPVRQSVAVVLLCIASFSHASNTEDLTQLRSQIQEHLSQHIIANEGQRSEITVNKLDSRLNLTKCTKMPEIQIPENALKKSKFSVKVRCGAKQNWSVHVPVNVRHFGPVVIATRHLSRTNRIKPDDIQIKEMEITRLNSSYFDKPQQVIGMIVKQPWRAGRALHPRMIRAPHLVKRGESVTIVAHNPNFNIRMKGRALMPGAKGQRIKVKNTSSKKTLEAVVISRGIVRVQL